MSKLIITTKNYDFIIYNLNSHSVEFKQPKSKYLDCEDLEGLGRRTHRPFGIEVCEDFIWIASHNKLAKFKKNNFEFHSLVNVPLFINTHQILKNKETLYVANTSVNNIGIYNLKTFNNLFLNVESFEVVSDVKNPKNHSELDINHVNSLFEYQGNIYFCLHNKKLTESYYGYFDTLNFKVKFIIEIGKEGHNIQIKDDILYTLSTASGELYEINLLKKTLLVYKLANRTQIFLRGLQIYQNRILIGCTNLVKNNEPFLLEMDLTTKNVQRLNLSGFDEIVDIKLL